MKRKVQTKSLQNGKAGKKPAQPEAQTVAIGHSTLKQIKKRLQTLEDIVDALDLYMGDRVKPRLQALEQQLASLPGGRAVNQTHEQYTPPASNALPDYDDSGDTTLYTTTREANQSAYLDQIRKLQNENAMLKAAMQSVEKHNEQLRATNHKLLQDNRHLTDAVEAAVRRLLEAQGKLRGEG